MCNFIDTACVNVGIFVGVTQKVGVKTITISKDLAQLIVMKIDDEGSNTENKLVIIIFSLWGPVFH